jgi:hypothetical protein
MLDETARNRLLRRIDWRFLLADPQPKISICFGDHELARALALISPHVVLGDTDAAAHTAGDLAVAVNPTSATLQAAWRMLRPGGSCYSEWYSPLAGGTKRIRRRLLETGFTHVTCYWAWPWPAGSRTRFWIPLEAPGALSYFLTSRPPAPNRVRHFARAVGRSMLILATLRMLPFPVCAVSRKPGPLGEENNAPLNSPSDRHAEQLGLTGAHQSWLMLTGGTRTIHKVVGLVFEEPNSQPRAIVKWPRVPEAVGLLQKEAAALDAVHSLRVDGVPGVPKVLFCDHGSAGFSLGESALTGVPLYTQLHSGNAHALALRAAEWLADLAGAQPRTSDHMVWQRLVEPIVSEFESTFGTALDRDLLNKTRTVTESLEGCPSVYEHRDFSPWNILLGRRGEISVLDWEGAEPHGLPLLDLLYFLAHLAFFLDGAYASGQFGKSYRASLKPSTLTGSVRAAAVDLYRRRLDLAPQFLEPLSVFVWLVHARSEYRRLVADGTGTLSPEQLRRAGYVTLWQEMLSQLNSSAR